jgi:arylsulfatase A-like enzyme
LGARHIGLIMLLLLFAACTNEESSAPEEEGPGLSPRPNVLLYVVDTLRADGLAPYGNEFIETPNLSRLAREGVLFEQAYSTSSWTRPAIASILTGLPADVHGIQTREHKAPSSLRFLAERYRSAGYRTAALVTNPNVGSFFGFDQGYDTFIELFDHEGGGTVPSDSTRATSAEVSKRAIEWIEADHRPFFLFILTMDPHSPYQPPERFDQFGDLPFVELENRKRQIPFRRKMAQWKRLYYGEIAFNDHSLGELLTHLDESELADDTIVVVTSDHGEHFGERGIIGHGNSLYQELVHVPLIVRGPGIGPAGSRISRPTQISAIHRSLTRLSALELSSQELEIMSEELPLEGNPSVEHQEPIYARIHLDGFNGEMIIDHPWKFILPLEGDRPKLPLWRQLYDLDADPEEKLNRQAKEKQVVEHLLAELTERRRTIAPHAEAIAAATRLEMSEADDQDGPEEVPEDVRRALEVLGYTEQ